MMPGMIISPTYQRPSSLVLSRRTTLLLAFAALAACATTPADNIAAPAAPLPGVAIEGRYALDAGRPLFGFPGAKLVTDAPGSVRLLGHAGGERVSLDVRVDDGPWERVDLPAGRVRITLGPDRPHRLTLIRRNEHWQGPLRIDSLHSHAGPLSAPALPGRRLLFIGDSITAGAGVDVGVEDRGEGKPLDNARAAFPRLLGDRLDAQVHQIAYGGRGALRDWQGLLSGTDGMLNAPAFYPLAVPDADAAFSNRWDPARFVPDAVVIGLGTNDFNTGVPGEDAFVAAYAGLIRQLRSDYPGVPVLILNSPMTGGERADALQRYLDRVAREAGAERLDTQLYVGRASVVGHPTDAQHALIADEIEPVLRRMLGL